MSYDPVFIRANQLEAALWFVIAACFAIAAFRKPAHRARLILATVAFALFGVSDLIETTTGAWWRPWWLFVWKTACVLVFAELLWAYWRRKYRPPPRAA